MEPFHFVDAYNGVTQLLGTVRVSQLMALEATPYFFLQLGGIGTHSIVATYNGTSSICEQFLASCECNCYRTLFHYNKLGADRENFRQLVAYGVIVSRYGDSYSNWNQFRFSDTTNANWLAGKQVLGSGTAGYQIAGATGSPVPVGNKPQSIVAGDFSGDGFVDLAVLNGNSQNISILKGDGTGAFTVLAAETYNRQHSCRYRYSRF